MTEWKEVESKVWKAENEGDQISGVLVSKVPKSGDLGARYNIENADGIFLVWGSAVLDDRMELVKVGSKVRITFEGKKPLDKGKTLNKFKVEVATPETNVDAGTVSVEDIEDAPKK